MKCQVRIGTRSSRLAQIQAERTVQELKELVPGALFDVVALSSPGDRDRALDLRESPSDFFTRDLDGAVLNGDLDCAVHSAKDVPDPMPAGLDWVWLPWREDSRDVLVAAEGRCVADLAPELRIGVSSDRRETYCRSRFPAAELMPIRGDIEDRLRQVDEGKVDAAIMAAAALLRLGLENRISEWIPLEALPTPEGQGTLALTFRAGDARFPRLRSLFVKAVTFVGAGVGRAELCTVAGVEALRNCDVCLFDSLIDSALLDCLRVDAMRVDVGKRSGSQRMPQAGIDERLTVFARRGLRVVRLKGGDPGIFGRLAEEVSALESFRLPYRVVPGVSSLTVATSGTGMLLTRRGLSQGFCAMSAREKEGKSTRVSGSRRAALPCVFFMGSSVLSGIVDQLVEDGLSAETPVAVVFSAGSCDEVIIRGVLADIASRVAARTGSSEDSTRDPQSAGRRAPGIIIVGEVAGQAFDRELGALGGRRILLTCSEALQGRAAATVHDFGGRPVRFPLIRMSEDPGARDAVAQINTFDWLVLTSPSAVRCLLSMMAALRIDVRALPRIMVSGPATACELSERGLNADLCPDEDFGGQGILARAREHVLPGVRILRLRSDRAGAELAEALRSMEVEVEDIVLYRNEPVPHECLPGFDMALFASASAVTAFVDQWGSAALKGKTVAAIGQPTAQALRKNGVSCDTETVEQRGSPQVRPPSVCSDDGSRRMEGEAGPSRSADTEMVEQRGSPQVRPPSVCSDDGRRRMEGEAGPSRSADTEMVEQRGSPQVRPPSVCSDDGSRRMEGEAGPSRSADTEMVEQRGSPQVRPPSVCSDDGSRRMEGEAGPSRSADTEMVEQRGSPQVRPPSVCSDDGSRRMEGEAGPSRSADTEMVEQRGSPQVRPPSVCSDDGSRRMEGEAGPSRSADRGFSGSLVVAREATVEDAVSALACYSVAKAIEEESQ